MNNSPLLGTTAKVHGRCIVENFLLWVCASCLSKCRCYHNINLITTGGPYTKQTNESKQTARQYGPPNAEGREKKPNERKETEAKDFENLITVWYNMVKAEQTQKHMNDGREKEREAERRERRTQAEGNGIASTENSLVYCEISE